MEGDAGDISFEIMYPRVMVKESEDPVSRQAAATAYMLRVIESLSLEDNGLAKSSVSEHISKSSNDSNKTYTKNRHPNSKNRHSISTPTTKDKSMKGDEEDNRSIVIADLISRPRAVLSSPDNDDIIGNQNKRIQVRRRSIKGQSSDNNGLTNRPNSVTGKRTASSTQCSYIRIQANNLHSDQRVERQPFNLNTLIQPKANNNDLKQPQMFRNTPPRANHIDDRLQSPSNNQRSAFSASNGYPKIKCSYSRHQSQEQ